MAKLLKSALATMPSQRTPRPQRPTAGPAYQGRPNQNPQMFAGGSRNFNEMLGRYQNPPMSQDGGPFARYGRPDKAPMPADPNSLLQPYSNQPPANLGSAFKPYPTQPPMGPQFNPQGGSFDQMQGLPLVPPGNNQNPGQYAPAALPGQQPQQPPFNMQQQAPQQPGFVQGYGFNPYKR